MSKYSLFPNKPKDIVHDERDPDPEYDELFDYYNGSDLMNLPTGNSTIDIEKLEKQITGIFNLTAAEKEKKCICGLDSAGMGGQHSDWCDKK